jgi:hypothetical protein
MLDNRETNSAINHVIVLIIFWTLVAAAAVLIAPGCAQIDLGNQVGELNSPIDAGTETGDSGTPAVFEGGALAPYRCLRDPRGKSGIGKSDAPYQIWFEGTQLFNCYAVDVSPPCRAVGSPNVLYVCSSDELVKGETDG